MKLYQAGLPYHAPAHVKAMQRALEDGASSFLFSYGHKETRRGAMALAEDMVSGVWIDVPEEVGRAFLKWLDGRPQTVSAFVAFLECSSANFS